MISANDLYLVTITPLFQTPVYLPPPPLESFIGNGRGSSRLDYQPNPPRICQTPLRVYHFSNSSPLRNFRREGKMYERKTIFKGDGYGRYGNDHKVFASLFH